MERLPKIARARLEQSAQAGPHPDADLITAFIENSLPPRERAQVIEHLSNCAQCRAVAGLAMPEPVSPPVLPTTSEQRVWLRWTALRWGTLAASAVVIAIAVLVLRPHDQVARNLPTISETSPLPPAAAPAEKRAEEAPASTRPAAPERARARRPAAKAPSESASGTLGKLEDNVERQSNPAILTQNQVVQRPLGGPRQQNVTNFRNYPQNKGYDTFAQPQAAPPPPAPGTLALENSGKPVSREANAGGAGNVVVDGQPTAQNATNETPRAANETVEVTSAAAEVRTPAVAKKDKVAAAPTYGLPGGVLARRNQVSLKVESPLRWTVGEGGKLMRSFDGGKTWTDVAVGDRVAFRALSAIGPDVWAGGAGGALFHSADAGAHWTRIRPVSDGAELAAAILRIEFTDLQHGTITTASGERWITTDGGRTWSVAQ